MTPSLSHFFRQAREQLFAARRSMDVRNCTASYTRRTSPGRRCDQWEDAVSCSPEYTRAEND